MTRSTRQSIEKSKVDTEMPPPPLPSANHTSTTTTTTIAPQPNPSESTVAVHKRIRSPLIQKAFDKALKSSLSGVTLDSWSSCFPTPCSKRPEAMKEVRKKFCEIYEMNVRV